MRFFPILPLLACAFLTASCITDLPTDEAIETTIESGPDAYTNEETARFTFSSDMPGATFLCSVDGDEEVECESPATVGTVTEGVHTFEVRAVSGGVEDPSPATHTWEVDLSPPGTTITEGPPAVTGEVNVTFEFSSTEPDSTFRCRLDQDEEEDCSAGRKSYAGLSIGGHTFSVYSVDRAGNKDDSPEARMFTVDAQGPVVTITGGPGAGGESGPDVIFTFEAPAAAVSFECALDGSFTPCDASGVTFMALPDGLHDFTVQASTAYGTRGPVTHVSWTVDAKGPEIRITSPTGETTGPNVAILFTSDDDVANGASFECQLDTVEIPCAPGVEFLVEGLLDGEHHLVVIGYDRWGNTGNWVLVWDVDGRGPTVQIVSPQSGQTYSSTVPVVLQAAPDPSGPVTFRCLLDGRLEDCSASSELHGLSLGSHTFSVYAADAFGNEGPEASSVFVVK